MSVEVDVLHQVVDAIDQTHRRSLDADNALLKVVNALIDRFLELEKRVDMLMELHNVENLDRD